MQLREIVQVADPILQGKCEGVYRTDRRFSIFGPRHVYYAQPANYIIYRDPKTGLPIAECDGGCSPSGKCQNLPQNADGQTPMGIVRKDCIKLQQVKRDLYNKKQAMLTKKYLEIPDGKLSNGNIQYYLDHYGELNPEDRERVDKFYIP